MVNSDAAGDLLEVQELHLQCQCATFKVILLDASDQLQHRVIQVNGYSSVLADVRFKGLLIADTLPFSLTDNRPVIDTSREFIEYLAYLAKLLRQSAQRHISEVKPREDSHAVLDLTGNIHTQLYPFLILRHIEKGFIQRDRFY